jgi:putative membrane protein
MGWMALWWILSAAVIAITLWALLRAKGGPAPDRGESPEEVLKRRYAKGEIDRQTYERMLGELRK